MSHLLEEVSRDHFPYPPATSEEIEEFERRVKWRLDAGSQEDGRYPLIDGWHEAWPDPKQCGRIAGYFSEFLEQALRSNGRKFWLKRAS